MIQLYEEHRDLVQILHHKCPVLKLARQQIDNVCGIEIGSRLSAAKLKRMILLSTIFLGAFWIAFMYGVVLGARACAETTAIKSMCPGCVGVLPGIITTQFAQIVF